MYIQKYRHFNVPGKPFYQKKNCKANGMYFWMSMYCHAEPVDKNWEIPASMHCPFCTIWRKFMPAGYQKFFIFCLHVLQGNTNY